MERIIRMLKSLPDDGAVPPATDADTAYPSGDTLPGLQASTAVDGVSDEMPDEVQVTIGNKGGADKANVESVRGHEQYDEDSTTVRLAAEAEEAAAALGPRSTNPGGSLMEVTIMEQVKNGRSVVDDLLMFNDPLAWQMSQFVFVTFLSFLSYRMLHVHTCTDNPHAALLS